jgi:hypothetical protein
VGIRGNPAFLRCSEERENMRQKMESPSKKDDKPEKKTKGKGRSFMQEAMVQELCTKKRTSLGVDF